MLARRGHELAALLRHEAALRGWAGPPLDCLFSIANGRILSPDVLRLPLLAINYHDSPLPRYAGTCATSWALLAGEPEHAVTWHVMTPEVDAGPVLVQRPVVVTPGDTALTSTPAATRRRWSHSRSSCERWRRAT